MSHRVIRINHEGDGDWVMERVGGLFNDKTDHSIGLHRDGRIVGGMVYTGYLGASIMMHVAGSEDNWVTRDFLWMIFDYPFNQLGLRVVLGPVASTNTRALSIDTRLGFVPVARIPEVYPDGADLIILQMKKADCRWLAMKPRYYRRNNALEGV